MQTATLLLVLLLDPWSVRLDDSSVLTLQHTRQNVTLRGKLTFVCGEETWKIAAPRDGVRTRLALVDRRGEAQGYITFQQDGDRLEMLVSHRTRQFYEGELKFDGTLSFRPGAFSCRVQASPEDRVLLLKSGAVTSPLDDAIFSPEDDTLLRLKVPHLQLTPESDGQFHVTFSGRIQETAEAVFELELKKKYFQKRYVPYYAPIDRKRCPKAPTGWMSWNTYFDKATAEDNLAEARVGKQFLQPFGLEFWSIESWQGNSDQLPVSNFYNLNLEVNERQFPEGMKKLAEDIRALGFRPGLWLAPFGTGNDAFYQTHKSWFLHDREGKPMQTWNGRYTIDPTNPYVLAQLRKIGNTASRQWGYEFFKIDGMSGSGSSYSAHFFERPEVRAAFRYPKTPNPFEQCVAALRQGIGTDRVFLACQGHATGPEAKYADASRIGSDIVHPNQPVRWENLLNQADRTLNQIFTHNIVFYADPDTLLVNDALTLEEARVSTTVVSLPGQMMFAGDRLAALPPERMKLLQQTLPVCDTRPGRLYPIFHRLPVWDLKIQRDFETYDVVALFNWTEQEAEIGFDFVELGLDSATEYVLYEFWTQQYLGTARGTFKKTIPAHAVRLLAVRRAQNVPQFLSSDRHVTQGAVDVRSCVWDAEKKTLTVRAELIGTFPTTFRFRIPDGETFRSASTRSAIGCNTRLESDGRVVAVTLSSETTHEVDCTLQF